MEVREIFLEALEMPTPEARAAYLRGACGQNAALRDHVDALLREHFSNDSLVAGPALAGNVPTLQVSPPGEAPAGMIGRYKLLEMVGEGGFGEVWMAEQREPVKRRVALKLIKLGMDSRQIVARFEAERQALALMDHANIAKIYDAGTTDSGRPYFVMELVRGVKITEYCDQNQLPTKDRLDLFTKVCRAIQHAHQKGIIHRDIKPSNILVTLHDGVPVPKVIDFGIAKATQQELTDKTVFTQFQQFIGTPAYMSPEQAELSGLDIDTRADIYSLGVLLYELLVGQTPFSAKEMMEGGLDALRRIIREREPQRPSTKLNTLAGDARTTAGKRRQTAVDQLVHQLQGDLDWIVMKCLEKDRVRRYDTANGLAADVQRYLANEPVVARPPSAGYRFTKTFQRNKLAFAAAGAIALALIAGITVSTWQAVRATRARQAAEQAQAAELAQKRLALDKQQEAESAQQRAEASEKRASDLLYSAKLNLAQVAYEQSNFGRVHELLEDTRDHPKRSFEWHYWQRQLHGESRILRGISGEVYRVAFSPDATRVAAHGLTHLIVWDAASGRELLNIPAPHPNFGDRFHYSSKVTFSPDGKQILMLAQDGLEVRDAFTGTSLFRLKGASAGNYAPDGRVIASVIALGPEPCIALWDAKTGDRMHTFRRVASDQETLRSARFTSDGRALLLSTTGGVSLLDATTGELIRVIIDTPMWDYPTVYLSHDGTRMLESDRFGGNGFVLDATKPQGQPEEFPGFGGIVSAEFSPDDRWLVATSRDRTARIIDLNTRNVIRSLKGHWGELHDVALSRDGRWVATASADGTVRIWDWETRQNPHLVGMKVGGLLSPDERLLLEMTLEGATLREFATGKVLREFFLHPSNDYIGTWAAGFSPDGTRVVTGSYQGTADVFDVATGARVFNLFTNATPRGVVYSPDGTKILTASKGGARTWDANTGRPLLLFSVGDSEMSPAIFSPNGRQVATTADPTGTQIWDAETGSLLRTLEPGGRDWNATEALAYSPDGRHLALGQSDGLVTIWNVTTGDKVVTLSGHTKGITSVQYSADGKRILTASVDKSARLWDAETGNELLALKGHETQVNSATFLADGRRILTSGWGQTLLWEAATPEASAAWGREQREAQENLKRRRAAADAEAKAAREARARELAALAGASESAPQHKPSTKGRPPIPGDPGAIRQWLVLGPLPFEGDAVLNVLRQQLPNEARLRPRAGVRPPQVPAGLGWTPVRLGEDSYQLNFVEWVQGAKPKADTDNQVAYAVAYIVSKTPQTGLLLLSGSDDTARVYLNEKEIYRQLNPRAWQADQDEVSGVELKAGLNVLVFKVANGIGGWAGSVRFTTADGGPVHGITVTLDPDASP